MSLTDLNREYDFSQSEYLAQEVESTPHIRGRRITVRDIGAMVHKRKLVPATIAERFDLPEAAVHEALAFYHLNPEYFARLEQSRRTPPDERSEAAISPPREIDPEDTLSPADLGVDELPDAVGTPETDADTDSHSPTG